MKVKDYLLLKELECWLENERDCRIRENNGYTNNPIEEIKKLLAGLRRILERAETED